MAAEYPIYAKVDASGVTQGTQKVKQDLRQVAQEATNTKGAIDKAFDSAGFDRSVGSLISRLDTLEKSLVDVGTGNTAVAASNKILATSLDQLAASGARAGKAAEDVGTKSGQAAKGQAALDAALRRVLQATDAEAAGQMKLNELLADAKRLLDAGVISQERYAQVQKLSQQAGAANTVSLGQQRAGYTQLGFQVQDITSTLALGINPLTVLSQQGGQTASALSLALGSAGTAGKVATFLAGPWGSLILAGVAVLGNFAVKAYEAGNETDKMAEKLKTDAHEADVARKAHEAFTRTIEGQIEAQRKLNEELDKSILTQRQQAQLTLFSARKSVSDQQTSRGGLVNQIGRQQQTVKSYESQLQSNLLQPEARVALTASLSRETAELERLKKQKADLDASIINGERAVREAEVPLIQRSVEASLDRRAAATERYTKQLGLLNNQLAIGAGNSRKVQIDQGDGTFRARQVNGIGRDEYARQLRAAQAQRDDAIKAAQDAKQQEGKGPLTGFINPVEGRVSSGFGPRTAPTAGASTFHKGIDIAAPTGTNVRAAAGGVVIYAGRLGGLGNAIIVDHGGGTITEYGHLSAILTQRNARVTQGQNIGQVGSTGISTGSHLDYRVKVGGKYVDPRGGRFRTDETAADQRAGNAEQAAAEKAARKAEQERDFVAGVENEAGQRGQGNRADTLQARIDRQLADFRKRFDREANQGERGRITTALTDADARETATRFDEAYVQPLKRLQALQGRTGVDREVLNRQLEESAKLGRELTPIEAQRIENSVRQTDALQRQQAVIDGVRQPLQDYQDTLRALNDLLATGVINQTQYNSRVADLGSSARSILSDMPGVDPTSKKSYSDIGAVADEDARYAREQDTMQANREQLLQLGVDYDALEEAARRRHVENLNKIDTARKTVAITAAQSTADSLLQIAGDSIGKQNAVYKALFVASKAFAIADAVIKVQQGIANAAALPFPANLPAIAATAAAAASIVSSIQSVALNLADGGMVRGPGGPRSDSVPANLSNGEFVVNARATSSNRALLEAINSGDTVRQTRAATNDNGGGSSARPMNVRIDSTAAPGIEWEQSRSSDDDMTFIARRVVREEAGPAAARTMSDPNSRLSRAMTRNTLAGRRRS